LAFSEKYSAIISMHTHSTGPKYQVSRNKKKKSMAEEREAVSKKLKKKYCIIIPTVVSLRLKRFR